MTPLEQQVWAAVYAVAWFQPTSRVEPGVVTDGERAAFASEQSDRAVRALAQHEAFERVLDAEEAKRPDPFHENIWDLANRMPR